MKLYLVQHGQAKTEEEDPKRPLSEKGAADVKKVAAFIRNMKEIKVTSIIHSGKTRAKQSADIIAETTFPSVRVEEMDGLEPKADPSIWANRLQKAHDDIMLVGHLPHLNRLASLLLCGSDALTLDFKMGSIACLEKKEGGSWVLRWMIIPELLGE